MKTLSHVHTNFPEKKFDVHELIKYTISREDVSRETSYMPCVIYHASLLRNV